MLYLLTFIIGAAIGFFIACCLVAAKDENWKNKRRSRKYD